MRRRGRDEEKEYSEFEDCDIIAASAKAVCVRHEEMTIWIPRSVVEDGGVYEKGDEGVIVRVEEWWCRKNEMI